MREISNLVLKEISTGLSLNEVKNNLNLPDKMFLSALKEIRSNYQNFTKKYADNGTVFYLPEEPKLILPPNKIELISTKNTFRAIFISDIHCGNKKDTLENYLLKNEKNSEHNRHRRWRKHY